MNYANTTLYACTKTTESKLGVKPKKKTKLTKIKSQKGKLILKSRLKR